MPKAFTKVTLNGHTGDMSVASDWIAALNTPQIVTEKGGFLFKATLDDDHIMLAVAPTLTNGERARHYDMHLEKEDEFTAVGDVNAQGEFTMMFKPKDMANLAAEAPRYIEIAQRFARFFVDAGYAGEGVLDLVTQSVLMELGLVPAPETLAELSAIG